MDLIRKIIAGTDPLKALAYYVGQKAGDGEINSIILDGQHLHNHGERRYLIYLKKVSLLWLRHGKLVPQTCAISRTA